MAERQSGRKMKILGTDNRKEYVNAGFKNYLKQHGIIHQTTNAYTPEQNGMAERANRSIVERAKVHVAHGKEHEEAISLSPQECIQNEAVLSDDEDDKFFTDVYDENSDDTFDEDSADIANDTVIDMTPVLLPRQFSYPPRSQVSRRSGREHKLPGKYNDFIVPPKGLPSCIPSQN
ncbi:uncharacterized protein LOC134221823 [Armigeres subalbatus]|uniref:uncharacterized protein LOC134221823 n=1 Tax=Armigeres subalbatus TaxID=124917 RepID=UPI002ED61BD2